jgi:hypothetical protein
VDEISPLVEAVHRCGIAGESGSFTEASVLKWHVAAGTYIFVLDPAHCTACDELIPQFVQIPYFEL